MFKTPVYGFALPDDYELVDTLISNDIFTIDFLIENGFHDFEYLEKHGYSKEKVHEIFSNFLEDEISFEEMISEGKNRCDDFFSDLPAIIEEELNKNSRMKFPFLIEVFSLQDSRENIITQIIGIYILYKREERLSYLRDRETSARKPVINSMSILNEDVVRNLDCETQLSVYRELLPLNPSLKKLEEIHQKISPESKLGFYMV